MKQKITYIISNVSKAIAFEWIADRIDRARIELQFILLNPGPSYLEEYLHSKGFRVDRILYTGKKQMPLAILKCSRILKKTKPDIVHCHLIDANMVGLTAAKLCGIKQRLYTRHHATFHHEYFPHAVKWDRYCNKLATHIIAISENVRQVLMQQEQVPAQKITTIYHGFDLASFRQIDPEKIRTLGAAYNPGSRSPVIGVISRFIELKGVQYIIPAFQRLLLDYPNALLLLFNAKGDYETTLNAMLKALPEESYKKIPFENDIVSLYHLFDVFVHVPVNAKIEAFGQTYIECLASGVPLIATKSGIGTEILQHKQNSWIVDYRDANEIYEALKGLLADQNLKNQMIDQGFRTVQENFAIETMIKKLESLYLQ